MTANQPDSNFNPFAPEKGVANEIIHRLYIGDSLSARDKKWDRRIDVRGLVDPDDKGGVNFKLIDALADTICIALDNQYETVLVHCWAGIERSALVVAWFLVKHRGFDTFEDAYDHIQSVRPCVARRMQWLKESDTFEDHSLLYRGF